MPAIQAEAPGRSGRSTACSSPARNSGKANIRPNVPALPNQVTSMRLAPSGGQADAWRPTTKTSRAITTQQNHTGRRSVDRGCRRRPRRTAAGRRPGRGSCRGSTPGGSGGRCSRRPSRWPRARRAAAPPRTAVVPAEQQPQEQRQAQQAHEGDDVGDREDPTRVGLVGRATVGSVTGPAYDPPRPDVIRAPSRSRCVGGLPHAHDLHPHHRRRAARAVRLARRPLRRVPVDRPARARPHAGGARSTRSTTGSTCRPALVAHLMPWPSTIGRAQQEAFSPERVGLIIAGLEVPHAHLHVIPIEGMRRPRLPQRGDHRRRRRAGRHRRRPCARPCAPTATTSSSRLTLEPRSALRPVAG